MSAFDEFMNSDEGKKLSNDSGKKEWKEKYEWAPLDDVPRAFRILGQPPLPTTINDPKAMHIVSTLDIKRDNGKTARWLVPNDPNFILRRIYFHVFNAKLEDKKTYKYPNAYKTVCKGGLSPSDGQKYNYSKGWLPSEMVVMNVIDRNDDWCLKNNHTKLLCSSRPGYGWIKYGVSAKCFIPDLREISKKSGYWENYDIAMTLVKDKHFQMQNVSLLKSKGILADLVPNLAEAEAAGTCNISVSPTPENLEFYDLAEYARGVVSFETIYNELHNQIAAVDVECGTGFLGELEELVAKEKATNMVAEMKVSTAQPAPVAPTAQYTEPAPSVTPTNNANISFANMTASAPAETPSMQTIEANAGTAIDAINASANVAASNPITLDEAPKPSNSAWEDLLR